MDDMMEPFSADPSCPKCACETVETRHCNPSASVVEMLRVLGTDCGGPAGIEHLHRVCPRCRYAWITAPRDAEASLETPYRRVEARCPSCDLLLAAQVCRGRSDAPVAAWQEFCPRCHRTVEAAISSSAIE